MEQSKLSQFMFIAGSVLPNTQRAYTREWVEWAQHLRAEVCIGDSYLMRKRGPHWLDS